ncbi:MAG: sulfotransferase [Deltaproteobacteria bacterium]|nr:sulfotransferase [Deltaproteobacteria bacterium]
MTENNGSFVFILGSPRSGTTILGEILDNHREISQWYEPYFVWDRFFRNWPHDERTFEDAGPLIQNQIFSDFSEYRKKSKGRIIIDKSPRNSLKVPFIKRIFPQARFIHILRDGRDATLSINKEWLAREKIVNDPSSGNAFNYRKAFGVIREWLGRQPFIRHKIRALWFETHGHVFNKSRHLNRIRWNGQVGWGPRFKGWESMLSKHSLLQFNAYQWLSCVKKIIDYWQEIPEKDRIMIRYENLIREGKETIDMILEFLKLDQYDEFYSLMPVLKQDNFNKWQKEFTREQINEIKPILAPILIELGYETNNTWPSDQ